jgi:putative transcriptional regulator
VKKKSYGAKLIGALEEAIAIERGEARPAAVRRVALEARTVSVEAAPAYNRERIAELRRGMDVSQAVFAQVLNVSPETVRAWEQGKREPDGAAVRLLQVAEQHPQWFLDRVRTSDGERPVVSYSARRRKSR